jgi:hypothetical protein
MKILEKANVFEKMAEQRLRRVLAQQTPAEPNATPTDPVAAQSIDPTNVNIDSGFRPTPSGHAEPGTGEAKPQPKQDWAREKQITENIISQSKSILASLSGINMQSVTDAQRKQIDEFMKKLYPALVWRRNWLAKGAAGLNDQDAILLMSEINGIMADDKTFYTITNGYKNMGSGTPAPMPNGTAPKPGPAAPPTNTGEAAQQKAGRLNVKKKY